MSDYSNSESGIAIGSFIDRKALQSDISLTGSPRRSLSIEFAGFKSISMIPVFEDLDL